MSIKLKILPWILIMFAAISCKEEQRPQAKMIAENDETRFTKVTLTGGLDEPTEFAILPDKRILLTERKGSVKLFDPEDKSLILAAEIQVYSEQEDGLMGIALDPDFELNGWVYLYYSPKGAEEKQHLSRFNFNGEQIDISSEIVMLEVVTQRIECCHTGGSIQFGPDGLLYLSTGDDTNPFGSDGFAPIDEGKGRSPWDAQKSSANTNDLRGKILRIRPEQDGTYTIPDGNLFPVGTPLTRPEIYVMGCRNPYRISIDQKRNWLFWGEVGPDAGKNLTGRGPRGHDEINLAMEAGNYGWPHFVGDNKPYNRYDYTNKQQGDLFNPAAPMNFSVNNTGMKQLPPANKALIWYPYASSTEFPALGKGGRNAMAGPVFYKEDFQLESNSLPGYFEGRLFIYDWIRGWIFSVSLNEDGTLGDMEPFMPNTNFNYMIDMELGPEGALYILEYGTGWFTKNDDSSLVRIDFNGGNRKPVLNAIADKHNGAAPLTVNFSSGNTFDYDGDKLFYEWEIEDESIKDSAITYTFNKPGVYYPKLKVRDRSGKEVSQQLVIEVGNDAPDLEIALKGNQSFYWANNPRNYEVILSDKEDGSLGHGILPGDVKFSIDYLAEGMDFTEANQFQGHQIVSKGERLISENDCKSCHKLNEKSIGPSYNQVAGRYNGKVEAVDYLINKVINGGAGKWGEQAMAAHPDLSKEDAEQIVNYILSVANDESDEAYALKGDFNFSEKAGRSGVYIFSSAYQDKGGGNMPSIQSNDQIILRNPLVEAEDYDDAKQVVIFDFKDQRKFVKDIFNGSYLKFNNIDLTEIEEIIFGFLSDQPIQEFDGVIELRSASPSGKLLGIIELNEGEKRTSKMKVAFKEASDLYFIFKTKDPDNKEEFPSLDWVYFRKSGISENIIKTL